MPKLTKRLVDAVEIRATEYFIWDEENPGFGLTSSQFKDRRRVVHLGQPAIEVLERIERVEKTAG